MTTALIIVTDSVLYARKSAQSKETPIIANSAQSACELRAAGFANVTELSAFANQSVSEYDQLYDHYSAAVNERLKPIEHSLMFECAFSQLVDFFSPIYFVQELVHNLFAQLNPERVEVGILKDAYQQCLIESLVLKQQTSRTG